MYVRHMHRDEASDLPIKPQHLRKDKYKHHGHEDFLFVDEGSDALQHGTSISGNPTEEVG
jgi:hypothetical protein